MHTIADVDDAGDDLAPDAKAEVVLIARPHHTHEVACSVLVLERNALHPDRTLGLGGGRGIGLAAGEQEQRGKSEERL